jgi:polar amino acid transport system substrate-binding protein
MLRAHRFVWLLISAIAVIAMSAMIAACGGGDEGAGSAANTSKTGGGGTIKVGSTLELAPKGFVDKNGNPTGFEVDVMEALAKRLNLKVEWVKTPFSQIFTGLAAKKFDVAASGVFITCDRIAGSGKVGEFTVPIYNEATAVTWMAGEQPVPTLQDLKGKKVGTESVGTTAYKIADDNKDKIGFTNTVFENNSALLLALQQHRVNAALQSLAVQQYATKGKSQFKVGPALEGTEVPSGFVLRSGDPRKNQFNDALNQMKTAGVISGLYKKWFGSAPESSSPAATVVPPVTSTTCASA